MGLAPTSASSKPSIVKLLFSSAAKILVFIALIFPGPAPQKYGKLPQELCPSPIFNFV
jgi:hypothetical protein